jgi:ATP-dependent Clp protease ATP-binding subunit ClpA
MTSNLGAAEMSSILRPNLGFAAGDRERRLAAGVVDEGLSEKVDRAGLEAARRKFTPEFMNRIDKTVVFHPLGAEQLRKVLAIELNQVQQRIFSTGNAFPFVFQVSNESRDFLLREGTDMKYGARHLKRAVDRLLVHPLSNLMATGQVRGGDLIRVDFDSSMNSLTFFKDAEDMPASVMAGMVDISVGVPHETSTTGAVVHLPQLAHGARSTKR